MKEILSKGELSLLKPDDINSGGGLSGEVHLLVHKKDKYVVRRCSTLAIAKGYESISKMFEKHGFLPKFLGRFGKDIFFEYIEGRDLTNNESPKVIEQLGKIAAHINKKEIKGDIDERFKKQLKELATGIFKFTQKESNKRDKLKIKKIPKPIFTKEEAVNIRKLYNYLKSKSKPVLALDANDFSPNNFRLRKGKVYFVDIESIKIRIKGFAFTKAYSKFCKNPKKEKYFNKGYSSISSMKFFTEEYRDFLFLNFYVQKINYQIKIFRQKTYKKYINYIWSLYNKYEYNLK